MHARPMWFQDERRLINCTSVCIKSERLQPFSGSRISADKKEIQLSVIFIITAAYLAIVIFGVKVDKTSEGHPNISYRQCPPL